MAVTAMTDRPNTSTITDQLEALERLTRTEVRVARLRSTQATSDPVRRELRENAANGERRAARIAGALRDLDAVPDVLSPVVSGIVALVTTTIEQAQPVEETLLGDLTLEHQLLDRARYLRVLADGSQDEPLRQLADDLVVAHTATVDWLTTVLAEEALGGPAALRPTPFQRVAGGVTRAVGLPARAAVRGVNRAVHTVVRTGENAVSAIGDVTATATRFGAATAEVASAGRDATLRRAEQVADREGANRMRGTVHGTRRELGVLDAAELPLRGYDELTAPEAAAAVRDLDRPEELRTVLAYEEAHKNRSSVVSAARARFTAVARDAAQDG
jgi:hypothetical protein